MVQAFRETIADLKRDGGVTVFLSSHVLTEVEHTCDRVGLIRSGRLVTTCTLHELRRQSPRRVTVRFARPVDAPPPMLQGVTPVSIDERTWVLDVAGGVGPLVAALAPLKSTTST
jgi:ABC-2 type transport system ATP-binding protein